MPEPAFRFVCPPLTLDGAPAGWAREMLRDGEIALLGDKGLAAVNEVAHELGQTSILLVRSEADAAQQEALIPVWSKGAKCVRGAGRNKDGLAGGGAQLLGADGKRRSAAADVWAVEGRMIA